MNVILESYELVKSLSKNEKGYFKRLHGSNKKGSKLLVAFDQLAAQKNYDKKIIQEILNTEKIGKNVLRDLIEAILKSLSSYNASSSSTFRFNMLLNHVETTFNSKRYKMCKAYTEKGMKRANKLGQQTYALQFSFWKRRLEGLMVIELDKNPEEWLSKDQENIQLLEDKIHLHHLGGVQTRILLSQIASEDVIAQLNEGVLNSPIIQKEYNGNSVENLFLHSGMRTRNLLISGDLEKALEECLVLLSKTESFPLEGSMIKNHFVLRLNVMRLQAFLKHHDAYASNRKELEALLTTSLYTDNINSLKPVIYPSFPVIHCAHLASKGETEYLLNYYHAYIENPQYVPSVSQLTGIEVGLLHSWSLFVSNDYRGCLQRIAKLYADYKISDYEKLNSLAKWLELLSCFEIRDESLFRSNWNSMQHYLQVKTQSSLGEKTLLKQLNSSFSIVERSESFNELLNSKSMDLKKLRMAFTFIDIVSWIKEKSEK